MASFGGDEIFLEWRVDFWGCVLLFLGLRVSFWDCMLLFEVAWGCMGLRKKQHATRRDLGLRPIPSWNGWMAVGK